MLSQLHIRNIAVIREANVALAPGLNIFTGETGAGKTILISAIDAVLGERTSRDIIRTGEDRAQVTALFEDISPRAVRALKELGYSDDEGSVLIFREIQQNGKGSCKINGMPATASILKSISSLLIHIHGQRDSHHLLADEQHMRLIDTFGELEEELDGYRAAYGALQETRRELASLEMDEADKARRIDMLTFQLEEIDAARLEDPDEEEALQSQRSIIKNSAHIRDNLAVAYQALRGDGEEDGGIDARISLLTTAASQAAQYITGLEPVAQRLEEIGYELDEYATDIRRTLDEFDFNPLELDMIESRLDQIYKLKRKYGESIAEILAFRDKAAEELGGMTTAEERSSRLTALALAQEESARILAEQLSDRRLEAADRFIALVEQELAFLDMPSVKLTARRTERALSADGNDDLVLYITTNPGEEPGPLSKIASGGEVSRIMLAIKNVLAAKDDIETLIFDEVDTGVSGRAAQKIGRKLAQVARDRQVICVTHLAQVAAFSDHHLLISKEVEEGRTYTHIQSLDEDAAVRELARITSGDMITETALLSARELRQISKKQC